jgi:hypothetical protein
MTVIIINTASIITSVKNIVDQIEGYITAQGDSVGSLSKEDLSAIVDLAKNLNNPDFQQMAVNALVNNIKNAENKEN